MSNCKFLKDFNHLADAMKEGFVIPTEFASNLENTAKLTNKAIIKKYLTDSDRLEMIYQLCPDSPIGYNSMNHQGLEKPKEMYKQILEKYMPNFSNINFQENYVIPNVEQGYQKVA